MIYLACLPVISGFSVYRVHNAHTLIYKLEVKVNSLFLTSQLFRWMTAMPVSDETVLSPGRNSLDWLTRSKLFRLSWIEKMACKHQRNIKRERGRWSGSLKWTHIPRWKFRFTGYDIRRCNANDDDALTICQNMALGSLEINQRQIQVIIALRTFTQVTAVMVLI